MSARPDLEGIRDSFQQGWTDDYWRSRIHEVLDYALQLEQDAAGARERLTALEVAIDNLFRVEAIDLYSDGTLEITSTGRLLDAIVDLMNVRVPTPAAAS